MLRKNKKIKGTKPRPRPLASQHSPTTPRRQVRRRHQPRPVHQGVPGLDDHGRCRRHIQRGRGRGVALPHPQRDGDVVLDAQVVDGQRAGRDEQVGGAAVGVGVRVDFEDECRKLLRC